MVPFRVRVLAHMSNNYPHYPHISLAINTNVSNKKFLLTLVPTGRSVVKNGYSKNTELSMLPISNRPYDSNAIHPRNHKQDLTRYPDRSYRKGLRSLRSSV